MEALGINLGFLILQILAFAIVFLTLQAWVYRPLVDMLAKRRKTIQQGLEDARIAADARAAAEKDAAGILAEAHAEAAQIVNQANERAEKAAQQVKADAEQEIARQREAALADIAVERDHMLADLRGQVAALAIAAAHKLIGEALDERRQHALLDEFFSGVRAGKAVVLEDVEFKGAAAEVTSALPLSAQEQTTIRQSVLAKVGAQAVTFRVDPAILGGLVIKVGDKVVDGSVSGKLEGLRENFK